MTDTIEYKFNEKALIDEFQKYVDSTYSEHYAKDKVQAMDLIIAAGHGKGFCVGDIIKYATRYGTKNGHNRADILKILHYAIFLLFIHDKLYANEKNELAKKAADDFLKGITFPPIETNPQWPLKESYPWVEPIIRYDLGQSIGIGADANTYFVNNVNGVVDDTVKLTVHTDSYGRQYFVDQFNQKVPTANTTMGSLAGSGGSKHTPQPNT